MGEKNIIGQRMRIARALRSPPMSQNELLAKMQLNGLNKITQSTVSKIESGDRIVADFELLVIAKALDVDILWLLGQKECNE